MNPATGSTQPPLVPVCPICDKPCSLEDSVTDAHGRAMHKECYRAALIEGRDLL
jgi:hypothetical protein